jgi:hypothetical protein
MPVNFTLVPGRAYHVRGIVTGTSPREKVGVALTSKAGDAVRATEVSSDGRFDLRGAAPGSYILRAESQSDAVPLTARQEVTVVAADVDGIRLAPVPAFRVSGHLRVEDQPAADLNLYSANLRQADLPDDPGFFILLDTFGENAPVDRQGNFEWKNVNPGSYIVQVYGGDGRQSFYVKSILAGGRNIDTAFTPSGPTAVEVVLSTKTAMIEGVVTERDEHGNDAPAPDAQVVAVPEEKFRKIPDRFVSSATDQFGRFTLRGLAPGTYTLFAWRDVDENLFQDPSFLAAQQAAGASVKAEYGSPQQVELKLSAVSDDWR